MAQKLPPLHPGEVLREEFLVPQANAILADQGGAVCSISAPLVAIRSRQCKAQCKPSQSVPCYGRGAVPQFVLRLYWVGSFLIVPGLPTSRHRCAGVAAARGERNGR
jgi:hypothetical protein